MIRTAFTISKFFIPMFVFLWVFSSCEKNDDPKEMEWPAEIEVTEVDYVGSTQVYFMADLSGSIDDIDEAGFYWGTANPPTLNDNTVSIQPEPGINSLTVSGLESETTYYVRAYYLFENETYFGDVVSFTTTAPVADNDGNLYEVIRIGNQLWTAENLRVVTYNNGDSITDGTGRGNYSGMASPQFFFHYDDDPSFQEIYGNLYTWHVITDPRGVCPLGWRVPDYLDWESMIHHLDALASEFETPSEGGMEISAIAGGMLRDEGTIEAQTGLWHQPNTGANNITRMNVLPTGMRDPSGAFDGLGYNAAFWTYTEETPTHSIMFYTHYFNPGIYANIFVKSSGYAIRCVSDAK